MPVSVSPPKRLHSQYRELKVEFTVYVRNPNASHVFDLTDKEFEKRVGSLAEEHFDNIVLFDKEKKTGFIHKDYIDQAVPSFVTVKVKERGWDGKPLNLFHRIWYLLSGRRWL